MCAEKAEANSKDKWSEELFKNLYLDKHFTISFPHIAKRSRNGSSIYFFEQVYTFIFEEVCIIQEGWVGPFSNNIAIFVWTV